MILVTVTSPYRYRVQYKLNTLYMEAKFNINCPLSLDEANEIQNTFKDYDIELYCGINQYIITNLGVRKYKYGKTNIKNNI